MKTLLLTDSDAAFQILGDDAGFYGDNGGDPDGNAWLPNIYNGNIDTSLAEKVTEAGYGQWVDVKTADSDDEMAQVLGVTINEDMDKDDIANLLQERANKLQWAHYGAYGVMDSRWIYISNE